MVQAQPWPAGTDNCVPEWGRGRSAKNTDWIRSSTAAEQCDRSECKHQVLSYVFFPTLATRAHFIVAIQITALQHLVFMRASFALVCIMWVQLDRQVSPRLEGGWDGPLWIGWHEPGWGPPEEGKCPPEQLTLRLSTRVKTLHTYCYAAGLNKRWFPIRGPNLHQWLKSLPCRPWCAGGGRWRCWKECEGSAGCAADGSQTALISLAPFLDSVLQYIFLGEYVKWREQEEY